MTDATADPYYRQYELGDDVRLQVTADGMISIHGTPTDLFTALPGLEHSRNGTSWKQYGAVTFFEAHAD